MTSEGEHAFQCHTCGCGSITHTEKRWPTWAKFCRNCTHCTGYSPNWKHQGDN